MGVRGPGLVLLGTLVGSGVTSLAIPTSASASGSVFVGPECTLEEGRKVFLECAAAGVSEAHSPGYRAITLASRMLWVYELVEVLHRLAQGIHEEDEDLTKAADRMRADGLSLLNIARLETFKLGAVTWFFEGQVCDVDGYASFAIRTAYARLITAGINVGDPAVGSFEKQCAAVAANCDWERCPEDLSTDKLLASEKRMRIALADEIVRYSAATRSPPGESRPSGVSDQFKQDWANSLEFTQRSLDAAFYGPPEGRDGPEPLSDEMLAELEAETRSLGKRSVVSSTRYELAREVERLCGTTDCASGEALSYQTIKGLDLEDATGELEELQKLRKRLEFEPFEGSGIIFDLEELGLEEHRSDELFWDRDPTPWRVPREPVWEFNWSDYMGTTPGAGQGPRDPYQ